MRRSWTAVAAATLAASLSPAPASTCDSSGCLLVTRGQNGTLSKGSWRVDLSFRGARQDVLLDGRREVDLVLRPKVDFESGRLIPGFHNEYGGREHYVQVDGAYGLTPRLTLMVSFPLFARRSYDIVHPPLSETYTTEGNGDLLLGARYALGGGSVASLGIKTPTGRHALISPNAGSTGILDPMLQPGTGSVDVLASVNHVRRVAGVDWAVTGSYQVTTVNDLGYRFGNEAIASVAGSRPAWGPVSGSLQFKVFHKRRATFDGAGVPSTGTTVLYVAPGVRVAAGRSASVYGVLQLPVFRQVNEAQLAPRRGYLVGVSRTF